jgi:glycosyltransferase involved in cell wall biosynthesis
MTIHTGLPAMKGLRMRMWRRRFRSVMSKSGFRMIAANGEARRSLAPYVAPRFLDRVPVAPSNFDGEQIDQVLASRRTRGEIEALLGLKQSDFRLIVGAQFIERKGVEDLLTSLEMFRDEGAVVDCLWLTPSPPGEYGAVLSQPNWRGLIEFRTQREIVQNELSYPETVARLGDCFILPSHVEGLPLALIEAMALGVPCISTTVNAIPEAIRSGHNGLLVPPHEPKALALAIRQMRDQREIRETFGKRARRDAWATFEVLQSSQATFAVFTELSEQAAAR